jgi:hypothetical protein
MALKSILTLLFAFYENAGLHIVPYFPSVFGCGILFCITFFTLTAFLLFSFAYHENAGLHMVVISHALDVQKEICFFVVGFCFCIIIFLAIYYNERRSILHGTEEHFYSFHLPTMKCCITNGYLFPIL